MQIILLEKVINLGQLGEIVKVKDGFARNYLIPHGMDRAMAAFIIATGAAAMGMQVTVFFTFWGS